MKHKQLWSLLIVLMSMVASSFSELSAQTWTEPVVPTQGSEPVSGRLYRVKNIEAGLFISGGRSFFSWATTAVLVESNPITFTMEYDDAKAGWTFKGYDGNWPNKYLFISGNNIDGYAMHVDNATDPHRYYELIKQEGVAYRVRCVASDDTYGENIDNWANRFWGWNRDTGSSYPNGMYAAVNPDDGYACEWEFIDMSTYYLRQELYNLTAEIEEQGYDISYDKYEEAYYSGDYDQTKAAYDELNALVNQARIYAVLSVGKDGVNPPSDTNPSNATSLITNPNFDAGNIDGWNCTFKSGTNASNVGYQTASHTYGDVSISKFIEAWANNAFNPNYNWRALGDAELSQTLAALPQGKYSFTCDAIATQQDGHTPVTGVELFATGGELEAVRNISTENGLPEHFEVTFVSTGGDITLGLRTKNASANWIAADNFTLTYYGVTTEDPAKVLLDTYIAELEAKYTDLYVIKAEQKVKDAYEAAMTAAKNATEDYAAKKTALENAVAALETSISEYAELKSAINALDKQIAMAKGDWMDLALELGDVQNDLQRKYEDGTASSEEIAALPDSAYNMCVNFISTALKSNPESCVGKDVTLLLKNPGFDTEFSGWTVNKGNIVWGGENVGPLPEDHIAYPYTVEGIVDGGCAEKWHEAFDICQTIKNLPVGVFQLSCQAFEGDDAGDGIQAELYAYIGENATAQTIKVKNINEDAQETPLYYPEYGGGHGEAGTHNGDSETGDGRYRPNGMSSSNVYFRAGLYKNYFDIEVGKPSDIKLGIRTASNGDWVLFDDFKLVYKGVEIEKDFVNFADAKVKEICVANWDANGDGELSEKEAAAVTDLGKAFYNQQNAITSFDELRYFTGLESIADSAFYLCKITSVVIPQNVTSIGNGAFCACNSLASVNIPNGVTSIGREAFYACNNLTSINIPNKVKTIGYRAFYNCFRLTSITIPESVEFIDTLAFGYCSSVERISVSADNPVFDSRDNCNAIIETASGKLVLGCSSTVIPSGVTSIGVAAFYECQYLTSINIPDGVTEIGGWAFYWCGLTSVTLPESVSLIGEAAFSANDLMSVTIARAVPPTIYGETTFSNRTEITLNVPKGSKGTYEAADYWKDFKEIVEYDSEDINSLAVSNLSVVGGESATVEIELNNGRDNLVAFQMDVTLPEGVSIDKTGCTLSSRIADEDQELTIGKLESGVYRLTSTSLSLSPISGKNGTLLTLKLVAAKGSVGGQATISNIRFSTANSIKVPMADVSFVVSTMYSLTYKVDGEEVKRDTLIYGTALTPEEEPTKEGYTFSGWSEIPTTMPAKDVVVTGSFTVNSYTLTYKVDGEVYKTATVAYGSELTPETAPTKEGYTFSGWSEIPTTMPAKDVVVTGTFTVNSYALTYKVDGEVYNTSMVVYGTTLTPETAPTKEGYTFSGWSEIPTTMPANDVVVTGTFTINSYTLTYKVDGEVYKTTSVAYGTALTAEAEPTKEGYTFGGWSEVPETMPANDVVVTGAFYLYGDVNTDNEVDVVDVVDIARFVIATPSERFREKLADLNQDKSVNITDAVTLINEIAGDQNFVKAEMSSRKFYDYEACGLELLGSGKNSLSFQLNGEADFTAFQFTMDVPEDMNITALKLNGQRKNGHQLMYNRTEDGSYRVVVLSLTNNVFRGSEGELLSISLDGQPSDEIRIRDIHFVTNGATDITFDEVRLSGDATGLDSLMADADGKIYDLQGRRLSRKQRGINIVGDKKVVVK